MRYLGQMSSINEPEALNRSQIWIARTPSASATLSLIKLILQGGEIGDPYINQIALSNIDFSQVFEPTQVKTTTKTHVLTETAGECDPMSCSAFPISLSSQSAKEPNTQCV